MTAKAILQRVGGAGRRACRRIYPWLRRALALVGLGVVVYWLALSLDRMVLRTTAPSLDGANVHQGDWVLSERVSLAFAAPARWSLVTSMADDGEVAVRRVVGLPGETVRMGSRRPLRVDERPLPLPAPLAGHQVVAYGNLMDGKPIPCGQGLYLLGDPENDLDDSRFNGPIPWRRLRGRPLLVVWPPEHIAWVRQE